jgi:hypothetical protein
LDELLESLPLGQRLQRYRQSADEALRAAAASKDEDLRGEFLAAAARWHMLAAEVERAAARIAALGDDN